jgi:hypothetical protein
MCGASCVQVSEADGLYSRVKNTISRMTRRNMLMAALWCVIGVFLLAAIVLIIYYKWIKKPSN